MPQAHDVLLSLDESVPLILLKVHMNIAFMAND